MTRYDLADDDTLLAMLAESIDEADPVPDQAVAAAKALSQLVDADAELATLVADSLLDEEVVLFRHDLTMDRRGGPTFRLVTFASSDLNVDVDLQAEEATLVGAITPPLAVDVELETTNGAVSTTSDERGRFRIPVPPGRCRVRIHAPSGVVVTPWITR